MAVPRETPYIWTTWLPRLLTGENSFEWAVWFKARHQDWTRTPSEFNQAQWMLDHTALLNERITNWEVGGFDVDVEAQHRFELHGKSATLAGRPDLVARRDDEAVIVDAKTGQENPSHVVQVMIYLYAVPVERSLPSETADGRIIPVDVGEATIRLEGLQFHTPVIFAEENEPSLLGVVSLEQAALAVDPLAGRLIPTNLLRL